MSKFLWSYLLISPAVLGATLVVSSSAMAANAQPGADALKPQAAKAETAETSEAKVNAVAAVDETTAAADRIAENSPAAGIETEPAIAASSTAATESAIATANTAPAAENPEAAPPKPATESLAAVEPTVAQPVENSAAAKLENPAPTATAIPEFLGAVQLETTAPAAAAPAEPTAAAPAEQTAQAEPVAQTAQAEPVAQTVAPQAQNPAATLEQLNQYSSEGAAGGETQGQVTSVSQLSDVRPTDWAFQALQSLVERYGCIAGYPDGTFRGNRAMTRYEFAAGLNACLDKVSELIRAGSGNLATKDDLAALQRLQEEFAAELATLRGRVDALDARTAELEANQFSTTTKLTGEAIFALSDDFGGNDGLFGRGNDRIIGKGNNETVFQQRVRLNLNTSFTGRDLLLTRLQVGNGQRFNLGATSEGTQTWNVVGRTDNVVALDSLLYKFPVGQNLNVTLAANAGVWDDIMPTVNPYFEDYDGGNGSLSAFGQRNPIYRLGGGAGIGFDYAFGGRGLLGGVFGPTSLSFGYLASSAASPAKGSGLFNGDYAAMGQLTFTPGRNLQVAFNYNHGYFSRGNFGFDNALGSGPDNLGGFTGTGVANSLNGLSDGFPGFRARKVVSNSYGAQASFRLSPRFIIGGWGGLTNARILGIGDAKIWNYAVTLALPDLGKEGNLLGFVVGREPYLDKLDAPGNLDNFKNDTSWHFEGFYKFKVSDNIAVTPGVIWITNPNQNDRNDDIIIGTLRTTFTF
ncbi:iron uptake porin [Tychonema sp. LEGE 07199]|uniref:iron uptake porin n=1 Tax=unclassified Tychonema TaxID=2642144 RepID=UPI001882A760|nr:MULTISPECIES: iron uptake porin [unclassified Tychonema]MBE9124074.1 iron uptake porin [Tychonema sp. LEGE 07199]MBE9133318.1 iron uptake porin [Tychonema sp. LEGE 07196]